MKQQETRLRLVTLLLLLVSMALVFSPWHLRSFAAAERGDEVAPSAALLSQKKVCPADDETSDLSVTSQRWYIHLTSLHEDEVSGSQNIKWHAEPGEPYSKSRHAIVIPMTAIYYVYVRTTLRCHNLVDTPYVLFKLELHSWNEGYNKTMELTQAWDGVDCSRGSDASRNVFVGQIFELLKGDHVSIFIKQGYALVTKAFFGAYVA